MNTGRVGASALKYWEARQAAAANNLANVSTPGFKAERVFAQLLEDATAVAGSAADFTPGTLQPTGRELDVALEGEGFFVVDTPEGERWVRGGAFSVDPEGTLVDGMGRPVLGQDGPIVVPPGPIEITEFGEILSAGSPVGEFRIERPTDGLKLERAGGNHWMPSAGKERIASMDLRVRQGHLEGSNVDPIKGMIDMIEVQRAYSAIQRTMVTWDGAMQTITNEIGRVG